MNSVRWSHIWQREPVSCSNDCATTESYTIPLLESSYGNIPSCSWPNHSSDVVKWSSRGFDWRKTPSIQLITNHSTQKPTQQPDKKTTNMFTNSIKLMKLNSVQNVFHSSGQDIDHRSGWCYRSRVQTGQGQLDKACDTSISNIHVQFRFSVLLHAQAL